jgi:hypothetical protein
MQASARGFAQALAVRIGEILPPPLTIRVDGCSLDVYADGISQGSSAAAVIVEEDDGRTLSEKLETTGRSVLSGIQDSVSEYLTLPWPKDARGRMATENARADAERLYLWFAGSEAEAVITLRPVDVAEIIDR